MEQIIANLLGADKEVQKATLELREANERPEAIPALCEVAVTSEQPTHRKYAAVLLTKRFTELRVWQMVPAEHQELIKQGMLNALANEKEKSVRSGIAALVSTIIKHDTNTNNIYMLQVLKFVFDHCASENIVQREVGTSLLDQLALHIPPEKLIPPLLSLLEPALKGDNPFHKRAAYLCMSTDTMNLALTLLDKATNEEPELRATLYSLLSALSAEVVNLEIYMQLEDPQQSIRKAAIEALTRFTISLFKLGDVDGAQKVVEVIIPKFTELLKNDEEIRVAETVLKAYMKLLETMKERALFNDKLRAHIINCMCDIFSGKVVCHCDGTEFELCDDASNVFAVVADVLQPQELAMYFGRLLESVLQMRNQVQNNVYNNIGVVYQILGKSVGTLKSCAATWFDALLPVLLEGTQAEYEIHRQDSICALGNLALYAGSVGQFTQAVQALLQVAAVEEDPINITVFCDAAAKLIIDRSNLVPLEEVLPVLVAKLPDRLDESDKFLIESNYLTNYPVFTAFQMLLSQKNEALVEHLHRVTLIGLHAFAKKQYENDETRVVMLNFLQNSKALYPDIFNQAVASDVEAVQFAKLLF